MLASDWFFLVDFVLHVVVGDKAGSEYLNIKATHYDGELNGIAQALEEAREVNMLAILTDSKPAISALNGAPPRSKIEARILTKIPA